MKIDIHLACEEDLQKILPLVSAYHEFEQLESTDTGRESAVRKLLVNKNFGGVWLVFVEEDLAGYIALCTGYSIEFEGIDAFVDEFYLSPGYRGKGVGKKVLELIKREARTLGVKALHLEVAKENTNARKLYSKSGFDAREKYILMSCAIQD